MFKFNSKFSMEEIEGKLELERYSNGRLAVILSGAASPDFDDDGGDNDFEPIHAAEKFFEPWATLSVNVPEASLAEGEFVAKTYSENEGLVEQMVVLGLMEETGKFVQVGYAGNCPVMRLTPKAQEHLA